MSSVLPDDEKWDLTQQIRRSSKSVMANVAEGYRWYYYQEVIRFCYIARVSLEETYSHLVCARDLGYLDEQLFAESVGLYRDLQSTLDGDIKYLKRTKQDDKRPKSVLQEPLADYDPDQEHP
ncbi:MAG: four helix bundle protein [Anaerolineae bacterium]|nr:four helix bundle protein [Anaerolineae bacterium]